MDQLDALVPWTTQVWTQVHHGTVPLWNPYSALGLPLAFNWQAAPFSLPTLVGYVFPVHLAFTVQIVVTLLTAGTGVYVFARALGLSVLACTFAAIAFELSGPFMGWLGQPVAAVMSWAGWLFFAALLVIRGVRRTRAVALFAVILALAIYAGQPETLVQLLLALLIYLVVAVTLQSRWAHGETLSLRSITDLGVAGVIGVGMSAPLVLPGVQLALHSLQSVPALDNFSTQFLFPRWALLRVHQRHLHQRCICRSDLYLSGRRGVDPPSASTRSRRPRRRGSGNCNRVRHTPRLHLGRLAVRWRSALGPGRGAHGLRPRSSGGNRPRFDRPFDPHAYRGGMDNPHLRHRGPAVPPGLLPRAHTISIISMLSLGHVPSFGVPWKRGRDSPLAAPCSGACAAPIPDQRRRSLAMRFPS